MATGMSWDNWQEMKQLKKEIETEFADLHNKVDKMMELLKGLVNPDVAIPTDEIRKMIDANT